MLNDPQAQDHRVTLQLRYVRESLYKALAPGAKPRYDTILKVMRGFGLQLAASPTAATTKVRAARAASGKKKVLNCM
jgi:hypothetical protein